jgi:hypothetical protein
MLVILNLIAALSANLQIKYNLFVGLINLFCRGLIYKYNPPIRKMLLTSPNFGIVLKHYVQWKQPKQSLSEKFTDALPGWCSWSGGEL